MLANPPARTSDATPAYRRRSPLEGLTGRERELAEQVNRLVEEAEIADRLLGQAQLDLDGTNTLYRKHLHSLGAFRRLAKTLIGRCDVHVICEKVVEAVAEEMGVERCSIMLLESSGAGLRLEAGASCRELLSGAADGPPRTFRVGEGVAGEAFRTRRSILIQDTELDPRFVRLQNSVPIRSLLCVPLLETSDDALGVLNLSHSEPEFFNDEHMRIFEMLCPLISQLISFAQLHEKLREMNDGLEMELRSLAENLPDSIARFDRHLRYVYVNAQIAAQTGRPAASFLGRTIAGAGLPPSYVAFLEPKLEEAFRSRQAATAWYDFESEKGLRNFEARVVPEAAKDGSVNSVLCLMRDITDRKTLEEQLRASQRMESIGTLAGGVAHDFNNLLTGIQGYTEMMLDQVSPDHPLHGDLSEVRKGAERAASLTRQLLAFSRKQILEPKVVDLNVIVRSTEKMLRRLIGEHIEVITVLPECLGHIRIDPGQLEQVIMNLAVNARDAMPGGGKLIIETADADVSETFIDRHARVTPGEYVMLIVSDSGTGIGAETQARIFEPFFTTKEQGKGTGLGLSTVHGIVTQSCGHISVYSEIGHGTTFKTYFPKVHDSVEYVEAAHRRSPPRRGTETILVAEDEAEVRRVVAQMLRRHGYTAVVASNFQEAAQMFQDYPAPIHLLLTDMVMPGGNGGMLAEALLRRKPELKVLFMSGYTDHAMFHHGLLPEGRAFIQKPFAVEALTSKLRELLDPPPRQCPAGREDAPAAPSGCERRLHPRFPFNLDVVLVCGGETKTITARDIGAGGMFLHAPNPPRVGTRVQVEFHLGQSQRHSLHGVVVRHEATPGSLEPAGFGIRFEVSEQERARLESALAAR